MYLLRYYFIVGGEKFYENKFSKAASDAGFQHSRLRKMSKFIKFRKYDQSRKEIPLDFTIKEIDSGIRGTSGDSYSMWCSAYINYVVEEEVYLKNQDLGMCTEYAQIWKREEDALLTFLKEIKEKLPFVGDFCQGEYFSTLKLIYGYGEEDEPSGLGFYYSERLMKALNDLDAGLESDSEPYQTHFERIKRESSSLL